MRSEAMQRGKIILYKTRMFSKNFDFINSEKKKIPRHVRFLTNNFQAKLVIMSCYAYDVQNYTKFVVIIWYFFRKKVQTWSIRLFININSIVMTESIWKKSQHFFSKFHHEFHFQCRLSWYEGNFHFLPHYWEMG